MNLTINLLPPELLPRRSTPPKKIFIGLACGFFFLSLYIAFLINIWILSGKVAELEKELALYEPKVAQAAASQKAAAEWRQKEKALQQLVGERKLRRPVLTAVNASLPAEVWLTRLEINDEKGELILGGVGDNLAAIGNFIQNLRSRGLWQEVSLQEVKNGVDGRLAFAIKAVSKTNPVVNGDASKEGSKK